jgi:hypothetical protein
MDDKRKQDSAVQLSPRAGRRTRNYEASKRERNTLASLDVNFNALRDRAHSHARNRACE